MRLRIKEVTTNKETKFYIQQKFLFWWAEYSHAVFYSLSAAKIYLQQCYDLERQMCLKENRTYVHYHCDDQ